MMSLLMRGAEPDIRDSQPELRSSVSNKDIIQVNRMSLIILLESSGLFRLPSYPHGKHTVMIKHVHNIRS